MDRGVKAVNEVQRDRLIRARGASQGVSSNPALAVAVTVLLSVICTAQAQIMWPDGGVSLTGGSPGQVSPVVVADGTGGTITTWQDIQTVPNQIRAQRLDRDGNRLWGDEGVVVCADTTPHQSLRIADEHTGGAVILWQNSPTSLPTSISGQRLDWTGNHLWGPNGLVLLDTAALSRLSSISESSFCICYGEYAPPNGLRMRRFRLEGNEVLPDFDVGLQTPELNFTVHVGPMASDGQGGAYVTWGTIQIVGSPPHEYYYAYEYLRHVVASGATVYSCVLFGAQMPFYGLPPLALGTNEFGDAFVTTRDYPWSYPPTLRMIAWDTLLWAQDQVSAQSVLSSTLAPDRLLGTVVGLWSLTDSLWLQRCDSSGRMWGDSGIFIGTTPSYSLAADDSNGAVVAYEALLAKWVRGSGDTAWSVRLCPQGDSIGTFGLVNDHLGGMVVEWTERRDGAWRIFGQRLSIYTLTGVAESRQPEASAPASVSVTPNPFGSSVSMKLALSRPSVVTCRVYSVAGELLRTITSAPRDPGAVGVTWDGRDDRHQVVPCGLYFCTIEADGRRPTIKVVKAD